MEERLYEEKGYLVGDFKLFYLEGPLAREVEYHCHSFDKLLVFYGGKVDYAVEGKSYSLRPGDVVLVPRGDSHRVSPAGGEERYSRLVIYLSPHYTARITGESGTLRDSFRWAEERHTHVVRPTEREGLLPLADALRDSVRTGEGDGFDSLYQQTLLLQFLIALRRRVEESDLPAESGRGDPRVVELIGYINSHLAEPMDLDSLSRRFYLSKYHLMRRFKAETGYTIGSYINQKRLLRARELLREGESVTRAALDAGFRDYSTFARAYKNMFGETPARTRKEQKSLSAVDKGDKAW